MGWLTVPIEGGSWSSNSTPAFGMRFSQVGVVLLDEHGAPSTGEDGAPSGVAFFPTDRRQILDTCDSARYRIADDPHVQVKLPAAVLAQYNHDHATGRRSLLDPYPDTHPPLRDLLDGAPVVSVWPA